MGLECLLFGDEVSTRPVVCYWGWLCKQLQERNPECSDFLALYCRAGMVGRGNY
jgi:hypothetical protein